MDAVPVVWIAPGASGAAEVAPSEAAARALEEWARARGVRLAMPQSGAGPVIHPDLALADAVEAELEKARDATSALDADGIDRDLSRAEGILRDHPELPQAAWLMAEVERAWATRWQRVPPRDPERAAVAWRQAAGLDGGREAGLGEEATATVDPDVTFTLRLDGGGELRLDAKPVQAGPVRATGGDHQIQVTREGRIVWAGWVWVVAGGVIDVVAPGPVSCSAEDLSRARLEGGRLRADGARCERWVLAQAGTREGSVLVALCNMDRCGAPLEWNVAGAGPKVPVDAGHHKRWPGWATWALIGTGAAAIAGVTIGIDEAFQSGGTGPTFTNGGHKQAGK